MVSIKGIRNAVGAAVFTFAVAGLAGASAPVVGVAMVSVGVGAYVLTA